MNANPCRESITQFDLSKVVLKNLNKFDLSPTAKLVLLTLVDCYNPKNVDVFPKQKTIANQLGISERSVARAIKEITNDGWLMYERKYTNRYKFTSKFFTLVKMSPESCQSGKTESANLASHEQRTKQINNNVSYFNFQDKNSNSNQSYLKRTYQNYNKPEGQKYPSIEATKEYIAEQQKIKPSSPLDFDRDEAIDWLENLPSFAQNGYFATEIRKRWNLS